MIDEILMSATNTIYSLIIGLFVGTVIILYIITMFKFISKINNKYSHVEHLKITNDNVFKPSRVEHPTAQMPIINRTPAIPPSPKIKKSIDVRKSKVCVIPDNAKMLQITSKYLNQDNYLITIEYYDSDNNLTSDTVMTIKNGKMEE